jgi:hypothetical protein
MSVTQVHEALGQFEFELLGNVPREVLDGIQHFDHIAVIPGRIDPRQYGDGCLDAARYVGVVRRRKIADDGRTNLIQDDIRISGVGMNFWLGDEDGKGAVIESPVEFTTDSFNTVINALVPDSVSIGTIHTVTGSYSGRHVYETPRVAIQYVCETLSTESVPVGYRVNNDASLDAGPESDLYVTTPTCIIMRKGSTQGEDMSMRALPSTVDMDIDMEDFTTRVVMLAESDGESLATGTADIGTVAPGVNVYKDLLGNPLALTRLVNESDTIEENADTRAELALRSVISPHRTLTIATDDFDIHGSFEVGDYIWVYDPDSELVDLDNEVYIRGIRINPIKLRVTEMDFPITEGHTVAHRDKNGAWTDLTDYIHFEETQPSQVVIGDFARDLTNGGTAISDRTNPVVPPNTSIPDVVTWVTPFSTANYLDGNGLAKASISVTWDTPQNTDATGITDGDRYELNVRLNGDTLWTVYNVAWGTNSFKFNDLSVAKTYEFRIRAIDTGNNLGAWSATESQVSSSDTIAPSTPAAPTIAASTIAVQVSHNLGKSSGGTFNLETDLASLEVHMSTTTNFTPSATGTLIGTMRANQGMMTANVPAIETFNVANTVAVYFKVIAVDTSGNKSSPSAQATTTALLVDDAHISDLVVSKVTAGTISANWLLGASIRTASSGQRVELNQTGLHAYNASGTELVTIDAATGLFTLKSASTGQRMELDSVGLRTYDSSGDLATNLTSAPASASGDYLSFRGTDGFTVAAISDQGAGSFSAVYADNELTVAGTDVRDLIDTRPRGMLAVTTVSSQTLAYNGSKVLFGRIKIPNFDATRQYVIGGSCLRFDRQVSNDVDRATIFAYLAWDAPASTASTHIFTNQRLFNDPALNQDLSYDFRHPFSNSSPGGTDAHIALYFEAEAGAAGLDGVRVQAEVGSRYYVEDVGPIVSYDNFNLSTGQGSGSGGGVTQQYTKTYSATWCGRYQGGGTRISSNSDIYQGQYDGTNGNQKSLIGFDYATIASDLSGSTIVAIKMKLKNKHWYYAAGGEIIIGTHNSAVSSAPTTWPGSGITTDRNRFGEWPRSATWLVELGDDIGEDFRDGTVKGMIIGPGLSTSKDYYGFFAGSNDSLAKPQLEITYVK